VVYSIRASLPARSTRLLVVCGCTYQYRFVQLAEAYSWSFLKYCSSPSNPKAALRLHTSSRLRRLNLSKVALLQVLSTGIRTDVTKHRCRAVLSPVDLEIGKLRAPSSKSSPSCSIYHHNTHKVCYAHPIPALLSLPSNCASLRQRPQGLVVCCARAAVSGSFSPSTHKQCVL
jgi:hypothetical protein